MDSAASIDEPTLGLTTVTPIIHSDIWFEDGNIVLEAGRKQFKVHRGILALHSSVFKDMLSVPQPPSSDQDSVDGCAVVRLSDSAEDLEIVLRALIKREYVLSRNRSTLPLSIKLSQVCELHRTCIHGYCGRFFATGTQVRF